MDVIIKAVIVVKVTGAILFVIGLAVSLVYTLFTEEPPLPHQQTWVCNDGDVQPPSTDREGCKGHGGLDHWEDGRR